MLTQTQSLRYNILAEGESLFCFGSSRDADRIRQGKRDPSALSPMDNYAYVGPTTRLLALGDNDRTLPVPDVAHDGFMWCGHAEIFSSTPFHSYPAVPGTFDHGSDRYVFEIVPASMDHVYVADEQAFQDTRERVWQTRPSPLNPNRMTDAEMRFAYSDRARTIVPITDYDGSYAQPIILVRCDVLGYDEIDLVSGPWPDMVNGRPRFRF